MKRPIVVVLALMFAILACNAPSSGRTVEVGSTTTVPSTPTETDGGETDPQPSPTPDTSEPTPDTGGARPTELTPDQIDSIVAASVQILAAERVAGRIQPLWTGSGTVISPDGRILTNCHVACDAPLLIILTTTNPDQPPIETYVAEITHADPSLDLALIEIIEDMDGNTIEPTDLPFLPVGDSNDLRLGDPIRVFGYPGVGGSTITFTSGSVSGFQSGSGSLNGQRVEIKTDADIASGNSGGTAVNLFGELIGVPTLVNPDIRDGVTIGGIGVLRPVNLLSIVEGQPVTAGSTTGPSAGRPESDPDGNEPNEDIGTATGPLPSGAVEQGYITWERDSDVFFFDVTSTQPITITLENIPAGEDFDLYLFQPTAGDLEVLDQSASTDSQEFIEYTPVEPGRFYVAVLGYEGSSSVDTPYRLTVTYDGGSSAGGGGSGGGIVVTGRVLDGVTGRPLAGGQFGILRSGVVCRDVFAGSSKSVDFNLVAAVAETNSQGVFRLTNVPDGEVYAAFFILGNDFVCENDWLDVPPDAIDSDLGDIDISF